MSQWVCPDCGREARITKTVGRIRCSCGYRGQLGDGPHRTPSERNARIRICRECPHWMDFRCKYIAAGCRPSFLAALESGGCPEDKWPTRNSLRRTWIWPSVHRLNLLYHVCPLKKNDVWRANVRQVRRRLHIFNGRKVVAVVEGEGLHGLNEVRREFGDDSIQWITRPNDPELREVVTFGDLLAAVESVDPEEATFYAHTKGNSTADNALGAELWRNAMYHHLLDGVNVCRDLLASHPCVGTHKMRWKNGLGFSVFPSGHHACEWMYAGTFFWFRHDAVYSQPQWSNVSRERYGAEAWPGMLFAAEAAATVFQPFPCSEYPVVSPYDPAIYLWPIRDT